MPWIALGIVVAEVALVLLSWMLSVFIPDIGNRSLLGDEGIRWLLGRHVEILAAPTLVHIILISIGWGCLYHSGLWRAITSYRTLTTRERSALIHSAVLGTIYVALILALSIVPRAILLGVDGSIFPSPFSRAIVSITAFGICIMSVAYMILSGKNKIVDTLYDACIKGIKTFAPLLLLYILSAHLIHSIRYVFFV